MVASKQKFPSDQKLWVLNILEECSSKLYDAYTLVSMAQIKCCSSSCRVIIIEHRITRYRHRVKIKKNSNAAPSNYNHQLKCNCRSWNVETWFYLHNQFLLMTNASKLRKSNLLFRNSVLSFAYDFS